MRIEEEITARIRALDHSGVFGSFEIAVLERHVSYDAMVRDHLRPDDYEAEEWDAGTRPRDDDSVRAELLEKIGLAQEALLGEHVLSVQRHLRACEALRWLLGDEEPLPEEGYLRALSTRYGVPVPEGV